LQEVASVKVVAETLEKVSSLVQVSAPKAHALLLWLPVASPRKATGSVHLVGKWKPGRTQAAQVRR